MSGRIWFTSDTHYGHNNISNKHTSQWKEGWRDFDNLYQMNKTIVKNINKLVGEEDVLYHLGDWSFGGIQNIWNFRKQLRCKTIHLILGNHCDHIRKNKRLDNCKLTIIPKDYPIDVSSITDNLESGICSVNAKDLFTSVDESKTVTHGKHTFYLNHYSHRVWYGHNKGVIHLYGHSHSSLEQYPWGKSMDVGIDNAKKLVGEYKPFSIEEIISYMDKRDIFFPDHHNAKTNIK